MPPWRIYGGQVLSQSVVATARPLRPVRMIHSMHVYFLRPGDVTDGITFAVDRIHDGRSFSTRRTQAFQAGVPIFSMIASFQDTDPGVDHQEPLPDEPVHEDIPYPAPSTAAPHQNTGGLVKNRPEEMWPGTPPEKSS